MSARHTCSSYCASTATVWSKRSAAPGSFAPATQSLQTERRGTTSCHTIPTFPCWERGPCTWPGSRGTRGACLCRPRAHPDARTSSAGMGTAGCRRWNSAAFGSWSNGRPVERFLRPLLSLRHSGDRRGGRWIASGCCFASWAGRRPAMTLKDTPPLHTGRPGHSLEWIAICRGAPEPLAWHCDSKLIAGYHWEGRCQFVGREQKSPRLHDLSRWGSGWMESTPLHSFQTICV